MSSVIGTWRPRLGPRHLGWVAVVTMLAAAAWAPSAPPAEATGGPGAIWTTSSTCRPPQDLNHYAVGQDVWVRGANFAPGATYGWTITGQPGHASSDPGLVVASGAVTADDAGAFCFLAYTVQPGDRGEYTVDVEGARKNDNYRVTAPASPRPSLTPSPSPTTPPGAAALLVRKWIDVDGRLTTAGDRVPAPGWAFAVAIENGSPADLEAATDADGWIEVEVAPGPGGATAEVEEALPQGARLLVAHCVAADGSTRGTAAKAAVTGIRIEDGDTVTCTFVNTSGGVQPGTPHPRVTPPGTDAGPTQGSGGDGGWRLAILGLVGLIVVLQALAPARLLRRLDVGRR